MNALAIATDGSPSFVQALEAIVEHPHRELAAKRPLVELEGLTEPDTERFLDLVSDPGALSLAHEPPVHFRLGMRDYRFTRVYDERREVTFDTYPNRYVRYVTVRLIELLRRNQTDASAATARRLSGLLHSTFFAGVSPIDRISTDHNVLRKDANYRVVLRTGVRLARVDSGVKRRGG